jgi:DNA-binding transcriptional regulator GbsR (MarR family)
VRRVAARAYAVEIVTMDQAARQLVEQMGLISEEDGLPRIAGRIFGYLLLEPTERSLDEIADSLGVSRASVSTDARRLVQIGLLERRSRPGDRRDYYVIAAEGFRRVIEQRIRSMRRFHELLIAARELPDMSPVVRDRIAQWDSAHEDVLAAFTAVLSRIDREA